MYGLIYESLRYTYIILCKSVPKTGRDRVDYNLCYIIIIYVCAKRRRRPDRDMCIILYLNEIEFYKMENSFQYTRLRESM